MSLPKQNIRIIQITTSPYIFENAYTLSIINNSVDELFIEEVGSTESPLCLKAGQSVSLGSANGFVLPTISLNCATMSAGIVVTQ
jgi:hypothetical protein